MAGVIGFLAVQNLDDADKWASVFSAVVAVLGLVVSVVTMIGGRQGPGSGGHSLEHPDAEPELEALPAELNTHPPAAQTSYEQNVTAQNGGQAFGAQGPNSRVVVHQEPPTSDTDRKR
ncbi:hypothetical protein J5X75_32315 [Actinoplanes sp. NEAU-H7]|uniref:Uncharacterized protein n=1 Tax=Actinoplanes flavus TaxID=2820290 RepID=A0ABS3UUF5_9ACTN|nr:hypothetical protein [Actinoplanes flavus]